MGGPGCRGPRWCNASGGKEGYGLESSDPGEGGPKVVVAVTGAAGRGPDGSGWLSWCDSGWKRSRWLEGEESRQRGADSASRVVHLGL